MIANKERIELLTNAEQRLLYWLKSYSQADIARHLGVSRTCICVYLRDGFSITVAGRIVSAPDMGGVK